jgi:hypothetical protein
VSRRLESNTIDTEYRYDVCLTTAVGIARFLMCQDLAFR